MEKNHSFLIQTKIPNLPDFQPLGKAEGMNRSKQMQRQFLENSCEAMHRMLCQNVQSNFQVQVEELDKENIEYKEDTLSFPVTLHFSDT